MKKMIVYYNDEITGTITRDHQGFMNYEYSESWRNKPHTFPISYSLPLSGSYTKGLTDHRFFANLLPEAASRNSLCHGLGISADNDFVLLAAIGGECAGALKIVPEELDDLKEQGYEKIIDEMLKKAIHTHIPYTRIHTEGKLRLSLAGAQDKWPVLYNNMGLFWPIGNSPSSHILKFASKEYKGLEWNEAYINFIVRQLKLPTVEVIKMEDYILVPRYDRMINQDGKIQRLHQEDICQALGYSSHNKYESEGGPGLKEIISLIKEISITPAKDILNIIRLQLLNLLLGNSDGHGKNISILYTPQGPKLAPFYDLVCTKIYPGISKEQALSTGGNFDPGQICLKDVNVLAQENNLRPRLLLNELLKFIENLSKNLSEYKNQFIERYGEHPVLERINLEVAKQIRRTRRLMEL